MVIKKLIAISVVFALVAGAAFAVDLGGTIIGSVNVAESGTDVGLFQSGGLGRIRLEGSGEAEIGIGTVGGWLRFEKGGMAASGIPAWNPAPEVAATFGLAWWQPIEQLRIQLGVNPDGHFDASHIGRYGFYAQANEIGSLVNGDGNWGPTSWDSAVFGGYGALHFGLIITPMDGVSINVAIPLNAEGAQTVDPDKPAVAAFKQSLFQVNYAADFGTIHVTYQGVADDDVMGNFFASANLGLIENLGLEVGVKFGIAAEGASKPPLAIGLGATYSAGQFGVKLRSIFEIAMESGATNKARVRVDVLPYFAVNENVTAYLDAGIYLPGKYLGDSQFLWHFAPYVRVGSEWGPGFYAGLAFNNVGNDGPPDYNPIVKSDKVNWSIPIGIIANF